MARGLWLAVAAVLAAGGPARGQTTYTWTGAAANSDWSTAANWQGGAVPASSQNTAVAFGASSQAASVNNLGAFTLTQLAFGSAASNYSVSGGDLVFRMPTSPPGQFAVLANRSSSSQTVANNLTFQTGPFFSAGDFYVSSKGTPGVGTAYLSLTGAVAVPTGSNLSVNLDPASAQTGGVVALSGVNSYAGTTRIYGGSL